MKDIIFDKLLIFYIFISLIAAFSITSTTINYFFFLAILGIWILAAFFSPKLEVSFIWFDLIPATFLISWAYGLAVACFLGNSPIFIVSNFAGMTLFIIYFFLILSDISSEKLIKILIWSAIIHAAYSYGYSYWIYKTGTSFLGLNEDGSIIFRLYYSPGLSVMGPVIAYLFAILFLVRGYPKTAKIKSFALLIFLIIPYAVLSFSKGYFASIVMFMAFVFFIVLFSSLQHYRIKKAGFIFLTFFLLFGCLALYFLGDELLFKFSTQEHGNSLRKEQSAFLFQEINFWGKGLGAVLDSGYIRSEIKPYGFELTFLNILHKFGFLGILVWIAYIICILVPICHVFMNNSCKYSWFAIGGMMFVIPGYGNPILFHPTVVILHCVTMYLIRCSILSKKA